jgi:uncharacterized membrane protein YphA (DoxX/SURF4 family)
MIQGGVYLAESASGSVESSMVGLAILLSGVSLVVGFFTPVAGALVALITIGIERSWFPPTAPNLFSALLPAILVSLVAVAIALLGPGALSVDCRLFGRREIIIPQAPRAPRS